jgi:hypothetical protein
MAADDDGTVVRVKLRQAGFHPLPLSGKRPAMDKWSEKTNVNLDEIRLWKKLYPWSENTGILTANNPTIDIDIMIPEVAEAVEAIVRDMFEEKGRILARFGNAPKRAVPLRTNEPFKKLVTNLLGPDGKPSPHKIEILGDGQQVVVHGIHPETRKPYAWPDGEPGDVASDELPYIHAEEAQDFIARCEALLVAKFGFQRPQRPEPKTNGTRHVADWTALVSNIIAGAELHDSIRDLAASFAANDITQDIASRLLQSLMLASTIPHDERWTGRFEDITRAILSGYDKFHREKQRPITLQFINMAAWDITPAPPRPWAVFDRIPARQPTLLSGEGSIGKTILELQLCCAHVLGRDWIGSLPERGPAIYLGAEDDDDELHRRLELIAKLLGVSFKDLINSGLHIMSFAGQDCLLGVPDRNGRIVPTRLFELLLEAIQDIKPRHVGIDTLADVFGGNEIDRSQVRQFVGLLRRLAMPHDGSVVLLGHPSLEGIRSGTGLSGSTGWHNSVRARMYFRAAGDDEDELRELEFKKNNYGRVADTVKLEYHNGVFRPFQSPSHLEKLAAERRAETVFVAVFQKLVAQGWRSFSVKKRAADEYAPRMIARHQDAGEFN